MQKYKNILAAVDFSEVSQAAAAEAVRLSEHYNAQLTLLHVVEHFPEHLPHYRMSQEDMDPQEFLIDRAQKDLKALCTRLGKADANQVVKLTTHSAKAEILKYVDSSAIDLIVIGAVGRTILADLVGGSTATALVRAAPCDVLTVRPRQADSS